MKGFTLVEMLVALLIFGGLAAGGVGVMRASISSQAAVRASAGKIGDFQRLRASLKADLGQAAPRRTRSQAGALAGPALAGPPQGYAEGGPLLSLVRRGWENPAGAPRASLQYVEYRVAEGRLERSARARLDGGAMGPPQILIEGVERAEVRFFGARQWSPEWTDPDTLPEAVRLDLELTGLGRVTQLFATPGAPG